MKVELDEALLKSVVSEAILTALDAQKREALIREAVQNLLSPGTDSWNRGRSPIEVAFGEACRNVACRIAKEMLENDEAVKAKIKELLLAAYARVTDTNREKTIERIADALEKGMAYQER